MGDARLDPEVANVITEPPYACPYCRSAVRTPPAPCYPLMAIMDEVGKLRGLSDSPEQAAHHDWSRFWPQEQTDVEDEEMADRETQSAGLDGGPREAIGGR
ncbi:hypothetical protein AAF712_003967 [Marasmius tenuissimus]|uniref:Uncharacterized protein n=1 Tax=Marasmius tenuissimus TaxID=585030 RepID=A0ABR3A6H1_9AGAR